MKKLENHKRKQIKNMKESMNIIKHYELTH
jgi:hypothetical protein